MFLKNRFFFSVVSFRYLLLKTHQLSLDAFLFALKFMQVDDVDIDEVQCILANLIYMVCADHLLFGPFRLKTVKNIT